MSSWRPARAALSAVVAGLASLSAGSPVSSQGPASEQIAIGLDHIPVAVRDLEAASATYRALGFAVKPGRPHANGVRNAHVKFPDGAGIELLTVPSAVDPLSTKYVDLIRAGEGPSFLSFHARDTAALHAAMRAGGYAFRDTNGLTDLSAPPFSFLFWIADNRSPTDRPEHFAHANGATALGAVWLATDDGDALARLLVRLGGRRERRQVFAPDPVGATVITLAEGDVFILPGRHQLLPGRPIIGASFRVSDLATVRRALAAGRVSARTGPELAQRLVVEPSKTHGLWVEFVGRPSSRPGPLHRDQHSTPGRHPQHGPLHRRRPARPARRLVVGARRLRLHEPILRAGRLPWRPGDGFPPDRVRRDRGRVSPAVALGEAAIIPRRSAGRRRWRHAHARPSSPRRGAAPTGAGDAMGAAGTTAVG